MNPININYSEKQASRFNQLNEKKIDTGILNKIKQFLGNFFLKSSNNFDFNWQTQAHAEHMSQGHLSGNYVQIALAKNIEVLKQMNNPPEDLIKALNYAKKIAKTEKNKSLISKANSIKNDIQELKEGMSLAVPCTCESHEMLLFITRQKNGNFKVAIHNQGFGVNKYHYTKTVESGKKLYQTALEIEDVGAENLCEKNALFIDRVLANSMTYNGVTPIKGTVDHLYSNLLPLLKGTIKDQPNKDPRLWSHGQLGGSCTAGCGISLIRSQLDENDFKEFRDIGRTEMLLKSYKQIKSGWGNNTTQKAVTLEVVKKLEHSLKKRNRDLPLEIKEMKRQLEEIHKTQGVDKPPITSDKLTDNLNFAFSLLKEGNFDDTSLDLARPYMEKALNASRSAASEEELKALWEISRHLRSFSRNRPLTINQIYMMTLFSSILLDQVYLSKDLIAQKNKQRDHLINFNWIMLNRYNALSLSAQFQNEAFDTCISHHQYKVDTEDIMVPEKLNDLIIKMHAIKT